MFLVVGFRNWTISLLWCMKWMYERDAEHLCVLEGSMLCIHRTRGHLLLHWRWPWGWGWWGPAICLTWHGSSHCFLFDHSYLVKVINISILSCLCFPYFLFLLDCVRFGWDVVDVGKKWFFYFWCVETLALPSLDPPLGSNLPFIFPYYICKQYWPLFW